MSVYFYELHEADDQVYGDVLVAHDVEFDEEQFLELVLEARSAVVDSFEEDSLVEAVANELERRHGFLHINDRRLRVSVNVSAEEGETFVSALEPGDSDGGSDEEDYRSMLIEADREGYD